MVAALTAAPRRKFLGYVSNTKRAFGERFESVEAAERRRFLIELNLLAGHVQKWADARDKRAEVAAPSEGGGVAHLRHPSKSKIRMPPVSTKASCFSCEFYLAGSRPVQ